MKPITFRWKIICIYLLLTGIGRLTPLPASEAGSPSPATCSAPEYRQFDFWVGDWDAFDFGGSVPVARVRVTRMLDGCALLEQYEDTNGLKGQSLTTYDASRKVWHQTWVTNRGQLLVLEGKLRDGEMDLRGADRGPDGHRRFVRGVWKLVSEGVRETATISTNHGFTWRPWFDLLFRPHKE